MACLKGALFHVKNMVKLSVYSHKNRKYIVKLLNQINFILLKTIKSIKYEEEMKRFYLRGSVINEVNCWSR